MRIGIICHSTPGGSGVVATELARALACRGHTVYLLSAEAPLRLDNCLPNLYFHQVVPSDYSVFRFRPYESALAGRLVRLAKQGLDLVHAHYAIPHAISAFLAQAILQQAGIYLPFLTTLHGTDTTLVSQDPDLWEVVRFALQGSAAVTAVSEALARESQVNFGLSSLPKVIPNFVDLQSFSPSAYNGRLRAAYAQPEELLLVHASNFRPVKQTPQLLEILRELLEIGLSARLLLIGDGPERAACEKKAYELGLYGRVHFTGTLQSIAPLLAIGDIFVFTSAYESFGLAALEAMACGVPVVAPAVGGLPELIQENAGRLYPANDWRAAREAILEVYRQHTLYRAGALRRASLYAVERIVPQYEALYQEALELPVSHLLPA
ncbi:MAG: N-acetyl-alpha-D-glucosaminyl L-malate synthase BshA [Bacteroidia bacterium]|nr:N-acetyl-alpha-D-glucosaminyl L-malate synthase BshA [Bacteroidia bacterium]MDW8088631.1 N-acetyl-alpha-D-glucosaminyl L-malate synthase BshA [Bacteroidia bacterium]